MDESLEDLEALLIDASTKLNQSAYLVRKLKFDEEKNIKRIGLALGKIFDIQDEIYSVRPELKPDFLK